MERRDEEEGSRRVDGMRRYDEDDVGRRGGGGFQTVEEGCYR